MASRRERRALMELATVVALAAVLGAAALPIMQGFADRARLYRAIGDIGAASLTISNWRMKHGAYPLTLAEAGIEMPVDPWGREYVYRNAAMAHTYRVRDRAELAPVNTDFDLFSAGRNGESAMALSSVLSRDDIVRAGNGSFIGLAEDY
jgi:general secretion pathway protein G